MTWLTKAGKVRVEHMPMPHPGQRVEAHRPKGILHTTEGSFESALNVFRRHFAPHFMVGRDSRGKVRILQFVPLGYMAAALENHLGGVETNREAVVQIEIVGNSKHHPWLPDSGITMALAGLMQELQRTAKIPLRHTPIKRDPKLWIAASGWFGHVDVPENEHWDPGELDYPYLLRLAEGTPPSKKIKKRPRKIDKVLTYRLVRRANGLVYTEPTVCACLLK